MVKVWANGAVEFDDHERALLARIIEDWLDEGFVGARSEEYGEAEAMLDRLLSAPSSAFPTPPAAPPT